MRVGCGGGQQKEDREPRNAPAKRGKEVTRSAEGAAASLLTGGGGVAFACFDYFPLRSFF